MPKNIKTDIRIKKVSKYLDESSRILVYKSFISSNFNYCPVSWMVCGKTNLNKLEKLRERALRFVFRNITSPYETLFEWGNFFPLSVYRIRCLAIEVFKCVHGNTPAYLNNLFSQSILKCDLMRVISPWTTKISYHYIRLQVFSLIRFKVMEYLATFSGEHIRHKRV